MVLALTVAFTSSHLLPAHAISIEHYEIKTHEIRELKLQLKANPEASMMAQIKQKERANDLYLLAKLVNAEAKGEPYNGKVAVANVVLNRVKSKGFPKTIKGVIYQKGQFDPVTSGIINNVPSKDSLKASDDALKGKVSVSNALFFYNPRIATDDWIRNREVVVTIGNHVFTK